MARRKGEEGRTHGDPRERRSTSRARVSSASAASSAERHQEHGGPGASPSAPAPDRTPHHLSRCIRERLQKGTGSPGVPRHPGLWRTSPPPCACRRRNCLSLRPRTREPRPLPEGRSQRDAWALKHMLWPDKRTRSGSGKRLRLRRPSGQPSSMRLMRPFEAPRHASAEGHRGFGRGAWPS